MTRYEVMRSQLQVHKLGQIFQESIVSYHQLLAIAICTLTFFVTAIEREREREHEILQNRVQQICYSIAFAEGSFPTSGVQASHNSY